MIFVLKAIHAFPSSPVIHYLGHIGDGMKDSEYF